MIRTYRTFAGAIICALAVSTGPGAKAQVPDTCPKKLNKLMTVDGVEPSRHALVQCLLQLENRIKTIEELQGLASGFVVARDRLPCPTGWSLFAEAASRVIVGAGQGTGLSDRFLGHEGR